jgi:hypothetical protein
VRQAEDGQSEIGEEQQQADDARDGIGVEQQHKPERGFVGAKHLYHLYLY